MNLKRAISGPILSIVFLIVFAYMISGLQGILTNYFQNPNELSSPASISDSVPAQDISVQDKNNNIEVIAQSNPEPIINSEAAISVESDLNYTNKILFEKNSNMQLPIASLTKLMTAVIVLDKYNLDDNLQVSSAADSQDSMKQDVKLGDTMPVESFLEIMLIESSNKSAYTLSEAMGEQNFVDLMNQKAKDLGLQNTVFTDPTGLSSKDISTAADLSKLAEYILKNYPEIAKISRSKSIYVPKFGQVNNTDELLGEIPEVVCSKTGFTTAANGCLLLVTNNLRDNDYLINIVLGANDRFSEMKKLISWSNATCN